MRRTFGFSFQYLVAFLLALVIAMSEAAESSIEKIRQDAFGSWLVDIDGETRTRTLNIKGAEKNRDGSWELDATYGWSDGEQTPVKAELTAKPHGYSLQLTTQVGSVISAEFDGAASFIGSFTGSSGKARPARLERYSIDEISKRVAKQIDALMKAGAPGPDVPAECASMYGGWTGSWNVGEGQQWLWIAKIDSKCVAKYQFGRAGYRGPFRSGEIKNGVLRTSGAENGSISWERHADDLWASYLGPQGVSNTVYKKVALETK